MRTTLGFSAAFKLITTLEQSGMAKHYVLEEHVARAAEANKNYPRLTDWRGRSDIQLHGDVL